MNSIPSEVIDQPSAPVEKTITRHRIRARRSIAVHPGRDAGGPDLDALAYSVHRLDIAGQCTYVRGQNPEQNEFNVSVIRPANTPPEWAGRIGLRAHPQLLVNSEQRLAPQSFSWKDSIDRKLLIAYAASLLIIALLGWWHMPLYAHFSDVINSRYAFAALVITGAMLWRFGATYWAQVHADVHSLAPELVVPLHAAPTGLKAGIASANLGDRAVQIIQGRATGVVHWVTQSTSAAKQSESMRGQARADERASRSHYRFELDGRLCEGMTSHQNSTAQPFIVEGDMLRVAIEPRPGESKAQVLAFANLSDGHVLLDETDPRIRAAAPSTTTPAALLVVLLPLFVLLWLALPWADTLSSVIFGVCVALSIWTAAAAWLRRELRDGLLRALGSQVRELPMRSVSFAPARRTNR